MQGTPGKIELRHTSSFPSHRSVPMPSDILMFAVIFLIAAFLHGIVGFGFPMVSTPLLAVFIDLKTAILLTLIPTILVNLITIRSEGNLWIAFRRYLPLAALGMFGSLIGSEILITVDSDIFKALLGAAILAYLFADKIKLNLSWVANHPKWSMGIFGIGAGILGGLTNTMAPILIIYSLESKHSKSELIQSTNLCFLAGKLAQLITFTYHQKVTLHEIYIALMAMVVISISLFMGIRLRKKIKVEIYRKLIRGLLFVLALVLFFQSVI